MTTMRCPTCHRSAPVLGGIMQAHLTAEGTAGERQCAGVGKPQRVSMTLMIRSSRRAVLSLEEASKRYREAVEASGEGASTMPEGRLVDGAREYRISYNGRIWDGTTLVFDPAKKRSAAELIDRAPLDIDDETPRTVEQIAAEIYRWHRRRFSRTKKGKVRGKVVIDYLTRIKRSPGIKNLQDHVMHCMAVLTDVAKRTGLAIVVLSQMTRGHVKEGRMPEMDDLKGGGDIEENAFHVVLLHPLGKQEDAAAGRPCWTGPLDSSRSELAIIREGESAEDRASRDELAAAIRETT